MAFMKTQAALVVVMVCAIAIIVGLVLQELTRSEDDNTTVKDVAYWLVNAGTVVAIIGIVVAISRLHKRRLNPNAKSFVPRG